MGPDFTLAVTLLLLVVVVLQFFVPKVIQIFLDKGEMTQSEHDIRKSQINRMAMFQN